MLPVKKCLIYGPFNPAMDIVSGSPNSKDTTILNPAGSLSVALGTVYSVNSSKVSPTWAMPDVDIPL